MALKGRAGHTYSQVPHPMHIALFTAGTMGDSSLSGSLGTIMMAPAGQWRAQLPQVTPSDRITQLANPSLIPGTARSSGISISTYAAITASAKSKPASAIYLILVFILICQSVYSLSALYAYHKFMRKTDYLFAAFSDSSFIYTIMSGTVSGADTDLFILYHHSIASFAVRGRYHCLYTASYGIFKNKLSVPIPSYH